MPFLATDSMHSLLKTGLACLTALGFVANAEAADDALALLRPIVFPEKPPAAFKGGFRIDSDQTIAILGASNAEQARKFGYIETLLSLAHPQHQLKFRNLAWQADTVYEQQRPLNFYEPTRPSFGDLDGRHRAQADVVFVWLGRSESLDGVDRLPEFKQTYAALLAKLRTCTERIVLVTPEPFEDPLQLGLNLTERNATLARYATIIREVAREQHLPVVDLFREFSTKRSKAALTTDGILLSAKGHWEVASVFAKELGIPKSLASIAAPDSQGRFINDEIESLRQAIIHNNDLWDTYWRPTNWAFLYGDRQTQPSSRSHLDGKQRWFPGELESVWAKLQAGDATAHNAATRVSNGR